MTDEAKKITVIEVGADGKPLDKSGAPIRKSKASAWLTPEQIEELVRDAQKPKPNG